MVEAGAAEVDVGARTNNTARIDLIMSPPLRPERAGLYNRSPSGLSSFFCPLLNDQNHPHINGLHLSLSPKNRKTVSA